MSQHFTCVDCGRGFTLSSDEQRFFLERGLSLPKRCPACRAERKRERTSGTAASGPPPRPAARSRPQPPEFSKAGEVGRPLLGRPARRASRSWWRNPYSRFGLVSLVFVLLAGGAALLAGPEGWVVWLVLGLAINLVTLLVYRYDKAVAGGEKTRVPELILHALSFFGGSPAAFVAMFMFRERHKVQKRSFVIVYWLIVALQVTGLCGLPIWWGWI